LTPQIKFDRREIARPAASVQLVGPGAPGTPGAAGDRWELICRDGWEWRQVSPGKVAVRVAWLSGEQALAVQEWLQRLKDPAFWWATSQELHSPGSSAEVGDALARAPWLAQVLPVLLEASTEGAPPPPPAQR
jgi:hypothetical protein